MSDDLVHLSKLRDNVVRFQNEAALEQNFPGRAILDIAPQVHVGIRGIFDRATVLTLDIDPESGADFIADITQTNKAITDNSFDAVFCTEVLEHVLDPFAATREIFRILKPAGILYGSTPLDLFIHGPEPDCWRFTARGLQELLKHFSSVEIFPLINPDRPFFPIHYTFKAVK